MESEGSDFGDFHEADADHHDSPTSCDQEDTPHADQPPRISLSSLFTQRALKEGARPAATHFPLCDQRRQGNPHHGGTDTHRPRGGSLEAQTSTLHQFLPHDVAEVQEWHPNRILAAVVQFVASRVDDSNTLTRPRRMRTKGFDPIASVRAWARTPEAAPDDFAGTWEQRSCGKRFFVKVMRITCRMSQRTIQSRASSMWKRLSHEHQFQWDLLRRIVKHEVIAPHVKELSENHHTMHDIMEGQPCRKQPRTAHDDTQQVSLKSGYGFVVTYNTSLGQDDPEVIKIVQSGVTGAALRQQLKRLQVYTEAFERLWLFANALANKYHLATVNVTLEHSEHGDHKARVHFHIFIGIDLSGGMGFVQTPALRTITYDQFQWQGIRPNVSATMTNRKSWGAIYQAVATGAYYVAGPKTSVIMKRSTFEPIEDGVV